VQQVVHGMCDVSVIFVGEMRVNWNFGSNSVMCVECTASRIQYVQVATLKKRKSVEVILKIDYSSSFNFYFCSSKFIFGFFYFYSSLPFGRLLLLLE
jgi:hypothetical protein